MNESVTIRLQALFYQFFKEHADSVHQLSPSGSARKYYRLRSHSNSAIGVFNHNIRENRAFLKLSQHFRNYGMNVPSIYAVAGDNSHYLIEDLGDNNLFDYLNLLKEKEGFSSHIVSIYQQIIDHLIEFQMIAGPTADFSFCYPTETFDDQSYFWDLNYFKYNFLRLSGIEFDEYQLEKDFRVLVQELLKTDHQWFVYRDFQTRNIMLFKDKLYFIDYQGYRKGPLHYDLASLLFQARADIPPEIREQLIDYYIQKASQYNSRAVKDFRKNFYHFALLRILQTLGAYGLRGLYERKQHFIQSIPFALKNLEWLAGQNLLDPGLIELPVIIRKMLTSQQLESIIKPELVVLIRSFSYKRGLPADLSGHGGGFVFDCRGLPNPGRFEQFTRLSGLDEPVCNYLESFQEVSEFLHHIEQIVQRTVEVYLNRGFTYLSISFGCTGGRHRSVYCAEKLARKLIETKGVKVVLQHLELCQES